MARLLQTVVWMINARCICSKSAANSLFQVVIAYGRGRWETRKVSSDVADLFTDLIAIIAYLQDIVNTDIQPSTFNLQRHLLSRPTVRIFRAEAANHWKDAVTER